MKPVNGWILVEEMKREDRTKSGIYIPDKVEAKIQRCKVLKISEDVIKACADEGKTLPYKEGDVIVCHVQLGLSAANIDGEGKEKLMKFDAVMAVEEV